MLRWRSTLNAQMPLGFKRRSVRILSIRSEERLFLLRDLRRIDKSVEQFYDDGETIDEINSI